MSYVIRIEQLPRLLKTIEEFHQSDVEPNAEFAGELCSISLNVRPLPSKGSTTSIQCPHCHGEIRVDLSKSP